MATAASARRQLLRQSLRHLPTPISSPSAGLLNIYGVLNMPIFWGLFIWLLLTALPRISGATGTVEHFRFTSDILRTAGEIAEREISVYVPADYAGSTTRYPSFYLLHGATGNNRTFLGAGYRVGMRGIDVAQIADRLIAEGKLKPLIIVLPDMSRAWGHPLAPYDRYLVNEIVPFIDRTFRTLGTRESRVIAGHSEGGHDALHISLAFPVLFEMVGAYSPGSPGGLLPDQHAFDSHDQKTYPLVFWLYAGKNDNFRLIPPLTRRLAGQIKAQGLPLTYLTDKGNHFNKIAARLAESLIYFGAHF